VALTPSSPARHPEITAAATAVLEALDAEGDFGDDLLRRHYEESDHHHDR
jgi:hypothetical protein